MRASRLLSIQMLLQMRGRVSASVLAREFEVSVRTIYRDVDALSASGVPVYAEPGRNGGVALHEGFRTRLTGLTPGEAAALPLAGLAGTAKDLGIASDAAAAHLKMLASLPADAGAKAQRMAQRFHLDPIPWYHRAEEIECLPALAAAVWQEKRIAIAYESWNGNVSRRLDPLGLVQKGGVWYLVAAARAKVRTYRVSNIRELEVLDVAATRTARFDLARYWSTWSADFEARLMRGRASIRISAEGCRILRAVAPAAAALVAATQQPVEPAGWVEAEIPIEDGDYSARQLLRLGSEVEVLAPEALRMALEREAKAVWTLYSRKRLARPLTAR
jgi:predicted DNA-binding transcriptional regulator YafY